MQTIIVDGLEYQVTARVIRLNPHDWARLRSLQGRVTKLEKWFSRSMPLGFFGALIAIIAWVALAPLEVQFRASQELVPEFYYPAGLYISCWMTFGIVLAIKCTQARSDLNKFEAECAHLHNIGEGTQFKLLEA